MQEGGEWARFELEEWREEVRKRHQPAQQQAHEVKIPAGNTQKGLIVLIYQLIQEIVLISMVFARLC
jgi:hypothetical protein